MRSDSSNSRAHSIPRTNRFQVPITIRWQTKREILKITSASQKLLVHISCVHIFRVHTVHIFSRTHGTHFRVHTVHISCVHLSRTHGTHFSRTHFRVHTVYIFAYTYLAYTFRVHTVHIFSHTHTHTYTHTHILSTTNI